MAPKASKPADTSGFQATQLVFLALSALGFLRNQSGFAGLAVFLSATGLSLHPLLKQLATDITAIRHELAHQRLSDPNNQTQRTKQKPSHKPPADY